MAQQPTSLLQYNFSPLHHHIAIQFSSHMHSLAIQFSSCNTNQANYTLLLQYNSNTFFFSSPLSCNTIARLQYIFFFSQYNWAVAQINFLHLLFFRFFFHLFFSLFPATEKCPKNTYKHFFFHTYYWKNTQKHKYHFFFISSSYLKIHKKIYLFYFFLFSATGTQKKYLSIYFFSFSSTSINF